MNVVVSFTSTTRVLLALSMLVVAGGALAGGATREASQPGSPGSAKGDEPYDPAPVRWDFYEHMWLKDFPRASSAEPLKPTYDEKQGIHFLEKTSLVWTAKMAAVLVIPASPT